MSQKIKIDTKIALQYWATLENQTFQYWAMSVNAGLDNVKMIRIFRILGNISNLHWLMLYSILNYIYQNWIDEYIFIIIGNIYNLQYPVLQFNVDDYRMVNLGSIDYLRLVYTS